MHPRNQTAGSRIRRQSEPLHSEGTHAGLSSSPRITSSKNRMCEIPRASHSRFGSSEQTAAGLFLYPQIQYSNMPQADDSMAGGANRVRHLATVTGPLLPESWGRELETHANQSNHSVRHGLPLLVSPRMGGAFEPVSTVLGACRAALN